MKFDELKNKIGELGLQPLDTACLQYESGGLLKIVLEPPFLWRKSGVPIESSFESRAFDYVLLNGITMHDLRSEKKEGGGEMDYVAITPWQPETEEEKESVEKIRRDIIQGTYKYIH